MKKLLSLTAAVLLLITTGCGRSNAPPASASSGTPSVSAPITEPTVESSDDTTPTVQKDEAAVKPQSSRRLDDSRIIPLYSERFTYTDPNGIEDTYFYEVPQIDDDTEDAKHINEMINYRYGYLVERAQDARSRNDFIDTGFIIWVSNWNGPVLSLQVTSSDTLFNHDVGSYHYNFATGQELTNLDLLEYMGYTDSAKTLNALQRATAQHFDVHFGGYDPEYTAMLYKMRAQSLSELDSVFTYYSIFPHFSNGFVVTVPMYTPAGSGMYWTDVQVDPNKRQASGQVLHGQDEWFTCDVTATGKVTVRALTDYVSSDGAVTYQDMKEWYELGDQTEFTVNGCYGNYVKIALVDMEDFYIELRADGTGETYMEDFVTFQWKDGSFYALTDPDTPAMTYTREGDLLTIEFDGMTMVFKRSDTKPEIDPALLDGGDDEYDGDGWIDGPDEPDPPYTYDDGNTYDDLGNTNWYGWFRMENYKNVPNRDYFDTDTYDCWGYIGESDDGSHYFEVYRDGMPDDPVITMWVNVYDDHIEPILDGYDWVLDQNITESDAYKFNLYPYNDSISLFMYDYEGDDGTACAVSFYMRLDGTEWNEELEELPPRYEEYKAALANK